MCISAWLRVSQPVKSKPSSMQSVRRPLFLVGWRVAAWKSFHTQMRMPIRATMEPLYRCSNSNN